MHRRRGIPYEYCLSLIGLVVSVVGAHERALIPASPLTAGEFEKEVVEIRSELEDLGLTTDAIEGEISSYREDRGRFTTYRDEDIRRVFPEIAESDEFSYHCFVALSQPQSHTIVYVSDVVGENRVSLKYLDCESAAEGLACDLRIENAIFSSNPTQYFSLDESIEVSQAIEIIKLYKAQGWNITELDSIRRSGEGFLLRFGRQGCACHREIAVGLYMEAGESVLEVSDTKGQNCA